jgi:hypothetical protein
MAGDLVRIYGPGYIAGREEPRNSVPHQLGLPRAKQHRTSQVRQTFRFFLFQGAEKTMGKLFRYGMAGTVLAMAGFYLATVYVIRHPDSVFARSGRAVFHLGTHSSFVFQVGQTVIREAGRLVLKASSQPESESDDPALCPPGEPQPIDEGVVAAPEPLLLFDNQVIQVVREQLPPIPFEGAEEPPLADDTKAAASPGVISQPDAELDALILQPGATMESCEAEKKMPRCFDDDKEGPPRMPRAEEPERPPNIDELFRFWTELFQDAAKETGGLEESEALDVDVPPPCQEDPVYHYQYPGCPFTGKCPFLDPPALRSDPSLREHKEKNRPMNPDFDSKELSVPERLKRLLPQAGSEEEELLPPPNVDTTEFRPSDAKPGEFDPQPM